MDLSKKAKIIGECNAFTVSSDRPGNQGLNIREYTAIHILAGLSARPTNLHKEHVAQAIRLTDELLEELAKEYGE